MSRVAFGIGICLICLLASALPATAITLEVLPATQTVDQGENFSVDVNISGLGEFSAPSLGAFDVGLGFDPTLLSFNAIEFGPYLGDEAAAEAIVGFDVLSDNLMAFEVSLLLPAELIDLQPGSFRLFTVTFGALAPGTSPLDLTVADLGDENGDLLTADVVNGNVEVEEGDDDLCQPDADTLCLRGRRFSVELEWMDFEGNAGSGRVVPLTSGESGLLWFFGPDNWEVLIKVLDGCSINDHLWVLGAAGTNVEYTLEVTDNVTGSVTTYFNPLGNTAGTITDTEAFASCSEGAASAFRQVRLDERTTGPEPLVFTSTVEPKGTCQSSSTDLCLQDGRFLVEVEWRDFLGFEGDARVVTVDSEQAGLFWFFSLTNWEMLVRVLDGCAINGRYWVFSGAATNVEYLLRVTDTESGLVKTYFNPLGVSGDAVVDTEGFGGCP